MTISATNLSAKVDALAATETSVHDQLITFFRNNTLDLQALNDKIVAAANAAGTPADQAVLDHISALIDTMNTQASDITAQLTPQTPAQPEQDPDAPVGQAPAA